MSDVTFGVKVTEEMKQELSELMKNSTLSGKEFMSMLLTSYKLEKSRVESSLFESDMKELQVLLNRVQRIYLNMTEKSEIAYTEKLQGFERALSEQEEEHKVLGTEYETLQQVLKEQEDKSKKDEKQIKELKEELKKYQAEAADNKNQLKNNLLLHTKFEEEVSYLKEQIEALKRLELEIEERNTENTKLKNRNDELASELWFLQREVEKLNLEKEQLTIKWAEEKEQMKTTHALEIKNQLLEQKLNLNQRISELREDNIKLERMFNERLKNIYELSESNLEKK